MNLFSYYLRLLRFFLLVHPITETNRHSTNGGEAQSPPNVSGFRLFVTIYSNNKNLSLLRRLKEEYDEIRIENAPTSYMFFPFLFPFLTSSYVYC